METMLDYLDKNQNTFKEEPFQDVDSLILCQLAYLKFDELLSQVSLEEKWERKQKRASLRVLDTHPDKETLFRDERYAKENRQLWERLVKSRRFRNIEPAFYVDIVDKSVESQFSAITFFLPTGGVYVAFRGTDESIIGWKEDFNMAFSKPIPAQEKSVLYLNQALKYQKGIILVGGHSKGGNLAIYASMNCKPKYQEKINRIYCMDGPGFREEVLEKCHYDRVSEKVTKILPHSSVIGMMFEKNEDFVIVESKNFGILQHDPYNWIVENGRFVQSKNLYEFQKFMDDTINEWVESLDEDRIRIFINALFDVLLASKADNLIDFTTDWKKSAHGMLEALADLDGETKECIRSIIKNLFSLGKIRMKQEVKERWNRIIQK